MKKALIELFGLTYGSVAVLGSIFLIYFMLAN